MRKQRLRRTAGCPMLMFLLFAVFILLCFLIPKYLFSFLMRQTILFVSSYEERKLLREVRRAKYGKHSQNFSRCIREGIPEWKIKLFMKK